MRDSLAGNHGRWFIGIIPSCPAYQTSKERLVVNTCSKNNERNEWFQVNMRKPITGKLKDHRELSSNVLVYTCSKKWAQPLCHVQTQKLRQTISLQNRNHEQVSSQINQPASQPANQPSLPELALSRARQKKYVPCSGNTNKKLEASSKVLGPMQ